MSGTSLDGIDVAIVDIEGAGWETAVRTVGFRSYPYEPPVRSALLAISNCDTHTREIARLHFLLGRLYRDAIAQTCRDTAVAASSLELIGCHGQTIYHEGTPAALFGHPVASTFQIGEPGPMAERFGVPVVSDFRPRDMAAGGQGAPLVPYVDYLLFRHAEKGRVILNLGGIANLTAIPPNAAPEDVLAFDTGPANMAIDGLIEAATNGRARYDDQGRLAAEGSVHQDLLDRLLADPFLDRRPPKSAGREQYGENFVRAILETGLPLADLVATTTAFTAASVAVGVDRFVRTRQPVAEVIVSGGGVHNPVLLGMLRQRLQGAAVRISSEFGLDADAKEAIAFAVLAFQTWRRQPANLPAATGAAHPVILGKLSF